MQSGGFQKEPVRQTSYADIIRTGLSEKLSEPFISLRN